MIKFRLRNLSGFLLLVAVWSSCSDDKDPQYPFSAQLSYSLVGKQAAFHALVNGSDSYQWDFGDGGTSTERDPVHVYKDGGYYTVTLKVQGPESVVEKTADLAVDLTPYVLLTGGATDEDGKTWQIDSSHPNDKFADADPDFTEEQALSSGILSTALGIGEVYLDQFTFYFDGDYKHDVKDDHASFGALVYQLIKNGGADIVSLGDGADEYGLCVAKYTPEVNATFALNEGKDYAVPSVYGKDGVLTFSDVNTLTFSGTEFIGFLDVNREVIVQEITDKSMRLAIFVCASPDAYPAATHALIMTFKAVN
jgi:PKD repeat protein